MFQVAVSMRDHIIADLADAAMRALAAYDPCFARAAEAGEPTFTLRAQDVTADMFVCSWADWGQRRGMPPEKHDEALAIADAMRSWPNRKLPD